jgi:hypothetical protein
MSSKVIININFELLLLVLHFAPVLYSALVEPLLLCKAAREDQFSLFSPSCFPGVFLPSYGKQKIDLLQVGLVGAQRACAASLPAMRPNVSERNTLVAGGSVDFE